MAKCLNCFINDNLTAVKKILKKFDKNFVNYFGLIAPRYILSQISSTSNDLDYIIQFKIIDEASCICEENANILKDLYLKIDENQNIHNNPENDNVQEIQVDFMQQYEELLMCIREIDEIIDFKIQYKEWFSFIKKGNKLVKNNPSLLENDIFNPLLSSTNYRDSLIEKFLSTEKAFYEIENVQVSISEQNKRNMYLILVHKFFYNTLLTCLIPTLYFFINNKTEDNKSKPSLNYIFIIILLSLSYISSYFSLFFFKYPRTKTMILISYFLFFAGSLFHILSCNINFNWANSIPRFLYLLISRIFIGIGSMELIGRKYIALYSPKFYLIKISKLYSKINILGYASGPLITCFILLIPKSKDYKGYMHYNEFNCIGWYGMFTSLILLLIHFFYFTRQNDDIFQIIKDEHNLNLAIKTSFHSERDSRKEKANKKLHKRKSKVSSDDIAVIVTKSDLTEGLIPNEDNDDDKNGDKPEIKDNIIVKEKEEDKKENENEKKKEDEKKSEEKQDEILNINQIEEESRKYSVPKKKKKKLDDDELQEKFSQSANSLIRINLGRPRDLSICSNNLDTGLNSSQILSTKQKKMINTIESKLDEYNEKSNFTNINMIPKAIDFLISKEKNTFGYLKQNILVSFLLIFFSNVFKENIILSFSYHLYLKKKASNYEICLYLIIIYLLQLISLFFVLPLKKINILMKKYLVIFMIASIIFISPLLYSPISESKALYFMISTGLSLLCSIITILCSSYLSYLLPPRLILLSTIKAAKLPLFLIEFGKFVGIIIGNLNNTKNYNIIFIFIILVISYVSMIVYFMITNNFRIKVIARIMRKRVFENIGI